MLMFLEGTAQSGGFNVKSFVTFLPLVLILVLMYFLMIRPQRKQEKKMQEALNNLAIGDEVTTKGGIIGKVVSIKEETFVLETTHDRTRIRFLRSAIGSIDLKAEDAQ